MRLYSRVLTLAAMFVVRPRQRFDTVLETEQDQHFLVVVFRRPLIAVAVTKRLHRTLNLVFYIAILLVALSLSVVQSYNSYACGSKQLEQYQFIGGALNTTNQSIQFTNMFPHRDDWIGLFLDRHSNNIHSLPWPETNAWHVQKKKWGFGRERAFAGNLQARGVNSGVFV